MTVKEQFENIAADVTAHKVEYIDIIEKAAQNDCKSLFPFQDISPTRLEVLNDILLKWFNQGLVEVLKGKTTFTVKDVYNLPLLPLYTARYMQQYAQDSKLRLMDHTCLFHLFVCQANWHNNPWCHVSLVTPEMGEAFLESPLHIYNRELRLSPDFPPILLEFHKPLELNRITTTTAMICTWKFGPDPKSVCLSIIPFYCKSDALLCVLAPIFLEKDMPFEAYLREKMQGVKEETIQSLLYIVKCFLYLTGFSLESNKHFSDTINRLYRAEQE